MKCHKCKTTNIVKANYCNKCGEKFTDKEREDAYNKTIYGKLEKIEKIKDIATLDIITGNIVFKIISLVIVLGVGLYFWFTMGMNTKILNSADYKIFYNKSNDQYYLLVDDSYDSVDVSMYRPNRVKKMMIYHYNIDNKKELFQNKFDYKILIDEAVSNHLVIKDENITKKFDI